MISISAQRERRPAGSKNAPTPERLTKSDAPVRMTKGRYRVHSENAAAAAEYKAVSDPLKHWLGRDLILLEQYRAGRRFQRLFEKATLGADCGSARDARWPCRGGQIGSAPGSTMARSDLDALRPVLGEIDFRLLCSVLGEGRDMEAEAPDLSDGRLYVGRRIRDALNVLAKRYDA